MFDITWSTVLSSVHWQLISENDLDKQHICRPTHMYKKNEFPYINTSKCPTRCNNMQSIFYFTAVSRYMFRVPSAPIIRST